LACTKQSFACLTPSFLTLFSNEESAACVVFLHAGNQLGEFGALEFLPSRIPSSTRVHASGPNRRALRLGVALLRLRRPYGVSGPPKTSLKAAAKSAAQTSSGPRQESTPWHLGAGPTRSLREG
jgi:hypothetical protein